MCNYRVVVFKSFFDECCEDDLAAKSLKYESAQGSSAPDATVTWFVHVFLAMGTTAALSFLL